MIKIFSAFRESRLYVRHASEAMFPHPPSAGKAFVAALTMRNLLYALCTSVYTCTVVTLQKRNLTFSKTEFRRIFSKAGIFFFKSGFFFSKAEFFFQKRKCFFKSGNFFSSAFEFFFLPVLGHSARFLFREFQIPLLGDHDCISL